MNSLMVILSALTAGIAYHYSLQHRNRLKGADDPVDSGWLLLFFGIGMGIYILFWETEQDVPPELRLTTTFLSIAQMFALIAVFDSIFYIFRRKNKNKNNDSDTTNQAQ